MKFCTKKRKRKKEKASIKQLELIPNWSVLFQTTVVMTQLNYSLKIKSASSMPLIALTNTFVSPYGDLKVILPK